MKNRSKSLNSLKDLLFANCISPTIEPIKFIIEQVKTLIDIIDYKLHNNYNSEIGFFEHTEGLEDYDIVKKLFSRKKIALSALDSKGLIPENFKNEQKFYKRVVS